MIGYIYVRNHTSYDEYNACKLGKTTNIPDRDSVYASGEIRRGNFVLVVEMSADMIDWVEKLLQTYFKSLEYHIYIDGGTEFYFYLSHMMLFPLSVFLPIKKSYAKIKLIFLSKYLNNK